jgi:hypothetical protein
VAAKLAQARGLHAVRIEDDPEAVDVERSIWVLVARDAQALARGALHGAGAAPEPVAGLAAWTDDFNNLFEVLK